MQKIEDWMKIAPGFKLAILVSRDNIDWDNIDLKLAKWTYPELYQLFPFHFEKFFGKINKKKKSAKRFLKL